MSTILFPTDFSKASLNAFEYALQLAQKIGAGIVALHVYDFPASPTPAHFALMHQNLGVTDWDEFENYKSEIPMLRKIARKKKLEHIPLSHVLAKGNAVTQIIQSAVREKAAFIVIGTTGATGLKEVFLGTVAEKVINQSTIPVLAIPAASKFHGLRKMLIVAELEKLDAIFMEQVMDFAALFGAATEVLQVKAERSASDSELLSNLNGEFKNSKIHFNIIHTNATEEIILDFVEMHKIDIAVMQVHHKGVFERMFLFSLSTQMAYHSTIPLLSIPSA